jgi:hypothetical protein
LNVEGKYQAIIKYPVNLGTASQPQLTDFQEATLEFFVLTPKRGSVTIDTTGSGMDRFAVTPGTSIDPSLSISTDRVPAAYFELEANETLYPIGGERCRLFSLGVGSPSASSFEACDGVLEVTSGAVKDDYSTKWVTDQGKSIEILVVDL